MMILRLRIFDMELLGEKMYRYMQEKCCLLGRKILHIVVFIMFSPIYMYSQIELIKDVDGLVVWLAADSVHIDQENYVDTVYDCSGNGRHAIQSTIGKQPFLIPSNFDMNAAPSLHFDGNDCLISTFDESVEQPTTFFVVWKEDVSSIATCFTGLKVDYCNQFYYNNSVRIYAGSELASNLSAPFDYSMFRIEFNQTNSKLYANQDLVSKGNVGTQGLDGLYVGLHSVGSMGIVGNISELIMFNKILSAKELSIVNQYIQRKYIGEISLGDDINVQYGFCPINLTAQQNGIKSYKWSTGETSSTISVDKSGVYSVEVVDRFGLKNVDTVKVDFFYVNQISDTTICLGDTIEWNPRLTGKYFYKWSDGSSESSLKITNEGKYWVEITDTLGYSWKSDTIAVYVDDLQEKKVFEESNIQLCYGDFLFTDIDGMYSYEWTSGDTTKEIKIMEAGVWGLTVKSNLGCGDIYGDVNVSIKGELPIPQIVSQNHCFGDNTELISNSYTTDNTEITRTTWYVEQDTLSGEVQNHIFESASAQIVTLEVENEVGCVQKLVDTITIHPNPIADFSPKIVCQYTAKEIQSSSTISSGKITSCSWSGLGKSSEDSSFLFHSDSVGNYPLTLKVMSEFGCSDEVTADVAVRPSTKIEFIHDKICVGDTVMFFDVSEYQSYNSMVGGYWDLDGRQNQYTETKKICFIDTLPHLLSLHVMTINGCENIAYDTVTANLVPRPVVQDTVFGCRNANVLLGVQGENIENNSSYVWTINNVVIKGKQPIVDFEKSGIYSYSVEVTSENDCSDKASGKIVIEETPTADFSFFPEYGAAPLDVDFSNLSKNASSYEWTMEQQTLISDENPHYTFTDEDNSCVKLQAFSKHGCADSITKYISVQLSNLKLQIVDIVTTLKNGFIQYEIQILNTGNDVIPEMEISIQSPDFPTLVETWFGALKANTVLNYKFTTKTLAKNGDIPTFLCASASIASANQNATYFKDEFCKDNSGEFMVYSIAPNPIEKTAQISFNTKQKGYVTIECYDETGKLRLSQEFSDVSVGFHTVQFDATQLPSGRYTIQIIQGNQKEIRAVLKL